MLHEAPAIEKLSVDTIRALSMDGVQAANSGHPGTPMALAPLAYTLFTRIMRHSPRHPGWPARDRFVLSAGHASMLLYSTLHLCGYDITLDDLKNFRQLGSPTAGHPEFGHAPGVETTTGPLGQGVSHATGMALGERILAERFNTNGHHPISHGTFVIASDGDIQEGIASESASLAGHLGLGRLIVFYDQNHITIEGEAELSMSEDVAARYGAYGWHVNDLGEHFDLGALERATRDAMQEDRQPSLIIVRTHIAEGAPNAVDTAGAHGAPLGDEEIALAKQAYGFPSLEPFHVPDEVREHMAEVAARGETLHAEWLEMMDAYRADEPELAAELDRLIAGELPAGWADGMPSFEAGGSIATRKASHGAIQWAAAGVPELVGGSADLGPSNLTTIDTAGSIARGEYGGRNIHFGIREHAMGAIVNGLTLSGLRGYGGTFLIFSDYMKPSIRLAALMGVPSIFVFTHDSIGLGEDGPTHQPIEQLWSLRATPNVHVVRPADANETALAWKYAIERADGPTCMALSRQNLPVIDPADVPADAIERGAYVLRDTDGEPDVILIGTGSEVAICVEAADALAADGISARVVSAPCLESFAKQDDAYRDSVLPPAVRARVAVEAGSTIGWYRWVGDGGRVVGMHSFGASAPAGALFEHFGVTAANVAEQARAVAAIPEGQAS
ncbi:MAG: transketolase [Actinobacteria bacterium]|nr:transketolase [Actinomycetota bacterium]